MLLFLFMTACGERTSTQAPTPQSPTKQPTPIKVDEIASTLNGDVAKDAQKVCAKEKEILRGLNEIDLDSPSSIKSSMLMINAVQQSLKVNVDMFLANQSQGYRESYENQLKATCEKTFKEKAAQQLNIQEAAKKHNVKF